jgi:hypothetical protein
MIDPAVTELRLALRARGFMPIPLEGKIPPMPGWQTKEANPHEIKVLWPKSWHLAENTGILAKYTPGDDIDITDEDAAEAIEHLVREHFEERGRITVRIGAWPKRLIPLRTDEPFTKLIRSFRAPDGTIHKIEILGDGQQWVTSGTHPITKEPYRWTNGEPGRDFAREDLPYVRREDVERFLDAAVTLLDEQHSFTLVTGMADANGQAHAAGEPLAASSRVAAAVAVIPNNDVGWDDWNKIGMAIWAATNGSAEGFEVFDAWSRKSSKYDARITSRKWTIYVRSPPDHIGFGTLKYFADKAAPAWEEVLREPPPEPHPDDPGAQPQPTQAQSDLEPQPDDPTDETAGIHWHGERTSMQSRAALVEDLLPETGTGLLSGQWGLFKTFCALDLAAAIGAPAGTFIEFAIARRGGTLFIAAEGASEIAIRLEAVLRTKYPDLTRAPFAWVEECPTLLGHGSVDALVAMARKVDARLRKEFDLPLALIVIDTVITAAGYRKSGDENDAAVGAAIMKKLATVSRRTGAFMLAVDHFGKDVSTGTRGTSVKETNADVVLALIGERSITGAVTDMRLAVRKRRSGGGGREFPFSVRVVEVPTNGKTESTLVIDWGAQGEAGAPAKPRPDDWGNSKAVKLLRRTIMALLADCGVELKPFPDGPTVRALRVDLVRTEFCKSYYAGGDSPKKVRDAKASAFKRAIDLAADHRAIMVREITGDQFVWLAAPPSADLA